MGSQIILFWKRPPAGNSVGVDSLRSVLWIVLYCYWDSSLVLLVITMWFKVHSKPSYMMYSFTILGVRLLNIRIYINKIASNIYIKECSYKFVFPSCGEIRLTVFWCRDNCANLAKDPDKWISTLCRWPDAFNTSYVYCKRGRMKTELTVQW